MALQVNPKFLNNNTETNNKVRTSSTNTNKLSVNPKFLQSKITPTQMSVAYTPQTPNQNAFNILNNANKVQSYKDINLINNKRSNIVTPNTSVPTFKTLEDAQKYANDNNINISNANLEAMKQVQQNIDNRNTLTNLYANKVKLPNQTTYKTPYQMITNTNYGASEAEKKAYEEDLRIENKKGAGDVIGDAVENVWVNTLGGTANTINALNSVNEKLAGRDTTSIDAQNLLNYNNKETKWYDMPLDVTRTTLNFTMPNIKPLTSSTSLLQSSDSAYKRLEEIYKANPNNLKLKKLYEEITNGTYKGTADELQKELNDIQISLYNDFKNKYTADELEAVAKRQQRNAEEYGAFGEMAMNAFGQVGNMVPSILTSVIAPPVGMTTLGLNAGGNAMGQAINEGAGYNEAMTYGTLSGLAEAGIETISGGLSNRLMNVKGIFNPSNLASKIGNKFLRGTANAVLDITGEGLEEIASAFIDPIIQRLTYDPNAPMATGEELWLSFRDSILPTLLMQGGGVALNKVNEYHTKQVEKIKNSNLPQDKKTELISETTLEKDKIINEIKNIQQPVQNVAPQSPNTQIQQQTNEVIPQQTETQQNTNLTPNNLQTYKAIRSDVENANLDAENKPQGLYLSNLYDKNVSDFSFPFKDSELNTTYEYDITPTKPLNVESFELQTDRSSSPIQVDAGVSALKTLVGDNEFNRINSLNKQQLQEELSSKYPQYDFSRYFDKLELMSAYGGIMAREQGYDAIIPQRSTNKWTEDVDNEIVALNNSILKRTDAQDLQKTGQNDVNPYNGYTNKEIENFEGGKIKVAKSDNDIINFVQTAKKVANNLKLYMSKVKKTTSDIIKTKYNINVEGYNISLKNDDVRKVYKDHGMEETETPRGQVPITEEDFALIPTIINEADNIELVGTSPQGKPAIRFEKNINGNRVVVTYVSDKHKNLELQTMYKFKNDKKIDSSTALYEKTPRLNTSEMDSSTNLINNIIPNSQNYVNNQQINLPTQAEQQQAQQELRDKLPNMKKPKLEDIAELTEEQAQLPTMSYKQRADKNTPYRRKFWDNVESSKIVSKDVKEQVNMTNYERKHNADVLENMKERLDTEPMKVAQEWFRKDIKKATEQDVALGAILLERYQAEGRIEEAVDVVEKLADMGTEAGRTVQMYSIFQRLTPEGMMMYQQRKLNSALETLTQKQTGKWVEQNKDKFKLTEDDATFITAKVQEAQYAPIERQKQIALAEIENRINDKLPPEAGQSVKAYRRIAMLFNPKTQVRNVVGNITVMPLNYVTDLVATAIDKVVAKKTGVRTTSLPNVKTIGKGFVKGASETIDDYRRGIRTAPTGSRYEIQNNAKSFNENTNSKARNFINNKLNGIDRMLSTVLELGDRPFYEASYQNALEGQMKANNVTEPTQEMIDIASNVALSQTWQDNNNYTQAVLGIRNAFNKININGFGLGDLIIPFAKTPANLTKAMVEYSPAGLIPALINYNDMSKAISRGDMTPMQQKKFVTSVGKTVAGTVLYAIAGALVQSGAITGSSDEDKDVANFEKNVLGIQPYSIKIGDKTFTYNWAQPLSAPFAIMADTYKMNEENAKWYEILWNAIKVGGNQLLENSFLQGIQELLSSGYGEDSPMDNLLGTIADLPIQFTPTLFGQVASMSDSTKRQTFEKDDMLATVSNEVKNKLPGAKNTLAPQVNTFGEEIQNYGGENNAFNVFLNPSNISKANASETQKELYKLYQDTKDKTIFPAQAPYSISGSGEKVTLSSKDRAEYQKTSGKFVSENLEALFDSEYYKSLDNDKKAEVVTKIVTDANNLTKGEYLETKASKELKEKFSKLGEIPYIEYYNAWSATRDIKADKNWKGESISDSEKKKKLQAVNNAVSKDLTKKQREILYELVGIPGY